MPDAPISPCRPFHALAEEYHIDRKQGIIWSRCWGVLSDADIAAHQAKLRADPAFAPGLNQLVDCRGVTDVTLSVAAVKRLGQSQLFAPESKRAYVVARDVIFGLVRMYELYQKLRDARNVRIFRDRAEAVRWLGVTDPAPGDPPRPRE